MTPLVGLVVGLAGLGLCVLFVRDRFSWPTSIVATASLAAGSLILWRVTGPQALQAGLALATGAALALGWTRVTPSRPGGARIAIATALAVGAAAPWIGAPTRWTSPDIVDVLWSSRGGILATSPMVVFALAGFVPLARIDRARAIAGAAAFGLVTYLVGSRRVWWIDAGPGPLPFVALLPYLACGVAAGYEALARLIARRPGRAAVAALSILVMWNVGLVALGHRGDYRLGEPLSFGTIDAAQARTWHGWIGHVPSYPANLIEAAWGGVSPGRVDLLRANRLLADGAREGRLDIGDRDGWFIGDGWHAPERDGDRSFRWATSSASVVVPVDHGGDLTLTVGLRPFDAPNGQPQQLTVRVNGAAQPAVTLASGWQEVRLRVPRRDWRSGINRVELTFALQSRPSDAGGGDTRWLAAAIDAIAISQ